MGGSHSSVCAPKHQLIFKPLSSLPKTFSLSTKPKRKKEKKKEIKKKNLKIVCKSLHTILSHNHSFPLLSLSSFSLFSDEENDFDQTLGFRSDPQYLFRPLLFGSDRKKKTIQFNAIFEQAHHFCNSQCSIKTLLNSTLLQFYRVYDKVWRFRFLDLE